MKQPILFIFRYFGQAVLGAIVSLALTSGLAAEGRTEFPAEAEGLVAATAAFFDRVEDKPPSAIAFRPKRTQKTKASAVAQHTDILTQNGPVRQLTAFRLTWYPVDRLLGAVDFMGTWGGGRNLVCGYLVWDVTTPDAPELSTVVASFIDRDDLDGKAPAETYELLASANCAHGAVDENYAFFEAIR